MNTCVEFVIPEWGRGRPCGRPGKVEVEGKWYCGIHDPIKRKAKRDASYAAYRAKWDAHNAKAARQALQAQACKNMTDEELIEYAKEGRLP